MTAYLLDASVLISLVVEEHEHHERAGRWAAGIDGFALCPVVEGALVRWLVRTGESTRVATDLLRALHAMPGCELWADSVSYVEVSLDHVRGHRQVTDAYLAGLASSRGGLLATLDQALAHDLPGQTHLLPG